MFKKNVISKKLFFVLGVILSIFVLCTNGERDNVLDAGGSNYSTPVSITVKADKDTVYINESVILKLNCDNESILDNFIWKTGKEEKKTVEDSIIYAWKKEGLKIISVYSVDKLTRESKVVFCTVFVELGKPVVELNSDTITSYIYDTVKCTAHATDNGTIKKYNWTTNIKNIEMSNDSIQKIVSKDTGLFFVIVSVEDNDSVSSLADTCVVIIKEGKPKAQIEFDTSIIEIRETVTISVDTSDENGVIKKFIWEYTSKNRDSTVHDTTKPGSRDFVWNDTGFVTISVIAVDDDGLFSETSRCTIYVDIGPKPTVLLDSNIVNSYINDSTTITATGSDENGTVTGFLWKEAETGKTYSTVDGQFSFVWREAGTRKITVQAVDNDGQLSDYDTCVIYIDSGIPVAIAHPNTIGSTTRQDGITVTLEAKDNNLEGELVWFWDTGSPGWDDSTSGPTRTFTSSNGGVITIIWAVRDDDNLFSKKDTFQISFNSPPCSTEIIEPKEVAQWNSFNKNSGTGSVKCIWTFDDPDSASDIKRCKLLIRNDYGTTMYTFQRDVSSSTFDTILTFATLSKYTWNMVVYDNFGDSAQSSGSFTTSFGSPVISEDPIGSTVFKGDTVTFSVIAEGNELLYQWYIDGTYAIPSANKAQYSLNSVDYADSIHEYYCIVSNPTGSDTSETVSIRVLPVKPVIDSIHYDTTVTQSEGAVFTVFASGEFLEYQWQKNGADILVDGSVLTIDSVALADNGSHFRCIVSNAGGSDTSEVMTLEVALALPVIISNPSDTTVVEGNRICLKVEAIGDSIKYQWQKDSTDLTGKTLDSLVIPIAAFSDSGKYRCLVSNSAGTVWSNEALLEVDSSFTLDITTTTGGTATPSEAVYLSSGSSCSITATPSEGYEFICWTVLSGDAIITDSTSGSTTIRITGDATIRANFSLKSYTLTMSSGTGGSTSPAGTLTLDHDESQTISATPSSGYSFKNWSVVSGSAAISDSSSPSTSVSITSDAVIRANFSVAAYTLTMSSSTGGSTYPSGAASLEYDEIRSITAIPYAGYEFSHWTVLLGDAIITDSMSDTTTVRIRENAMIRANFSLKSYTLTMSSGTGGSTSPAGTLTLDHGESQTISATPSSGYSFKNWSVVSGSAAISDSSSPSTSVSITSNATVRAIFSVTAYTLTMSSSTGGSTYPSGTVSLESGESRSITAIPSAGYKFDYWTVLSGNAIITDSTSDSTTILITEDAKIRANFSLKSYTLTMSSGAGGSTTPAGTLTLDHGESQTISATPSSGYSFKNWSVVSGSAAITNSLSSSTTVSITSNATVKANFEQQEVTINLTNKLMLPVDIYINDDYVESIDALDDISIAIDKPSSLKVEWELDNSSIGWRGEYLSGEIINTSSVGKSYSRTIDNIVDGQEYFYARIQNLTPYLVTARINFGLIDQKTYNVQSHSILTFDDFGYHPLYLNSDIQFTWNNGTVLVYSSTYDGGPTGRMDFLIPK